MKNILFLSSWYPTRVHTTLGNFVNYHAKAVSLNNDVNVLYIVPDDSIKNYELEHFKEGNVTTTIVYFRRGFFKYLNYWKAFKKGLNFLLTKKEISFDIVHMNILHPAAWQPLYLKWKYKLPFIVSENWHGFQDLSKFNLNFLQLRLLKTAFNKADCICPVSQQLKEGMINVGFKANFKIIPNVVNTDIFNISNSLETKEFTFIHVSTLDDSIKNVSGIINAFKGIDNKDCRLRIIGDGDVKWIFKLIDKLNLADRVSVEGEKTYEEVASAIKEAQVFVLFSNIENLPLVLIESLSTGTPFIATKVGGIPEIFDTKMGVLVERNDIQELTKSMSFVKENYNKYDPKIIRNYALKYFSYEKVGNQFNDLYKEILTKKI
jgi:glycosyltransferase involved in cell wall biosynthesis